MLNFENVDRIYLSEVYSETLTFGGGDPFPANYTVGVLDHRKAKGSGFQKVRVRLAGTIEVEVRMIPKAAST